MSAPFQPYPDAAAPVAVPAAPVVAPAAPVEAPALAVAIGELIAVTSFDAYATPQRERDQLAIVCDVEDQGATVRAYVLGYADDAAAFPAGSVKRWQPAAAG